MLPQTTFTILASVFWVVFGLLSKKPEEDFKPEKMVSTFLSAIIVGTLIAYMNIQAETAEQIFLIFWVNTGLVATIDKFLMGLWRNVILPFLHDPTYLIRQVGEIWTLDRGFNHLHYYVGILIQIIILGWMHEGFHLMTMDIFGGEGYATWHWGYFLAHWAVMPSPIGAIVTAFAGGLGTAALCLLLWTMDSDPEDRAVFLAIGWMQLLYGVVEGAAFTFGYSNAIWTVGPIAQTLGMLYAVLKTKELWTLPDR